MRPKNFLITGAARGIGRGLSRLLLAKGHRVFLIDNNKAELAHTISQFKSSSSTEKEKEKDQEAQKSNENFSFTHCDLRSPTAISQAVHSASTFFQGKLDVLINNAAHTAVVGKHHLSDLPLEDWNDSLAINLTAPMLLSQACLPLFQQQQSSSSSSSSSPPSSDQKTGARGNAHGNRARASGCIINISSTRAVQSEANNEPYSASKAGLLGLTQSMAVTLAPQQIRVNAILPGWIHVEDECEAADEAGTTWEEGLSEEDHRWHLTGRVGKVEDVLRAVEYLVECEGVSGSEVVVDGGVTRKMVYPE